MDGKTDYKNQVQIWVVGVHYGGEYENATQKFIKKLSDRYEFTYLHVRTDIVEGSILNNPNEAMEFSGYQEGVLRVISAIDAHLFKPQQIKIIFFNDTVISGHFYPLFRAVLIEMLDGRNQLVDSPVFCGLQMPTSQEIMKVSGNKPYSSTWIFSIIGNVEAVKGFRFYEDNEIGELDFKNLFINLPSDYKNVILDWINPKSFFRGWYKALPGRSLDSFIHNKKILTIYLEHSLPRKLCQSGFVIRDISLKMTIFNKFKIKVLRLIDKIHINYLKLSFRIKCLYL
jgi:hypothetical protein